MQLKRLGQMAIILSTSFLLPLQASAAKTWNAGSDWWDVNANWSPTGQPGWGENVGLLQSDGATRVISYRDASGVGYVMNSVTIDATGGGSVSLSQTDIPGADELSANWEYVGDSGTGVFNQSGGTNMVTDLYLGNTVTGHGTYNLSGSARIFTDSTNIANAGTGIFNQSGGQHAVTHDLNLGNTATANASYTISGGTTTVGDTTALDYNSSLNLQGGSFRTNDVSVGATSYLTGTSTLQVTGDFFSNSAENTAWDTTNALLSFTGGSLHDFSLTGLDLGASLVGYTNNFAWGSVSLDSGSELSLLDGNLDPGAALYVGVFSLADGLAQLGSINSNGFNIYYNPALGGNTYLGGATYGLTGGGELAPVPEPASILLLSSGLLGLMGFKKKEIASESV